MKFFPQNSFFILLIILSIIPIPLEKYIFASHKLDLLYSEAEAQKDIFESTLNSVVKVLKDTYKLNATLVIVPLKTRRSIMRKLANKKDNDLQTINDIIRCSILFEKEEDFLIGLQVLKNNTGSFKVLNVDNKMNNPPTRIKHWQIYLENEGFPYHINDEGQRFRLQSEVQFYLYHHFRAKSIEQPIYEINRLKIYKYNYGFFDELELAVNHLQESNIRIQFSENVNRFFDFYNQFLSCEIFGEMQCESILESGKNHLKTISETIFENGDKEYKRRSLYV